MKMVLVVANRWEEYRSEKYCLGIGEGLFLFEVSMEAFGKDSDVSLL